MGKKLKVRSKIAPNHVAIVEVPYVKVAEETFDLYDFAYKLTIHESFWTGLRYEVGRLTCPHCGKVHKDLKMKSVDMFDSYFNRVDCSCEATLYLRFWDDTMEVRTYTYAVPDGYELAESETDENNTLDK